MLSKAMARSSDPIRQPSPALLPPRWLRLAAAQPGPEAALAAAGGVLALLDSAAHDPDPTGLLWRRRLALAAAVAVARLEQRREDAAALRDGWVFTRPGDDPGPAGRLLAGWRHLTEPRALQPQDWPQQLPRYFDLAPSPALTAALEQAGRALPGRRLPLQFAAETAATVLDLGPAYRGLTLWLADASLARALGWRQALPLLATALPRAALRAAPPEHWLTACASAWATAGLAALQQRAALLTRAADLRAAAPKLRGRDAAAVVAQLLSEDAIAAQAGALASDRAARRIFDRLSGLGLVRELSGRTSFRLYGL